MSYDWEGSRILQHTVIPSKRFVIGSEDILIPTDLREWITQTDSQEIDMVLQSLDIPVEKVPGSFDKRARIVWEYVIKNIEYCPDRKSQLKLDFWQFPAETIALKKGDCEDSSFLLASLMISSGISPFCVRVIFGQLHKKIGSCIGHTWPVYKDERGIWRILESTLDEIPDEMPSAEELSDSNRYPYYNPEMCLNQHHVWIIDEKIEDVRSYLKVRKFL